MSGSRCGTGRGSKGFGIWTSGAGDGNNRSTIPQQCRSSREPSAGVKSVIHIGRDGEASSPTRVKGAAGWGVRQRRAGRVIQPAPKSSRAKQRFMSEKANSLATLVKLLQPQVERVRPRHRNNLLPNVAALWRAYQQARRDVAKRFADETIKAEQILWAARRRGLLRDCIHQSWLNYFYGALKGGQFRRERARIAGLLYEAGQRCGGAAGGVGGIPVG